MCKTLVTYGPTGADRDNSDLSQNHVLESWRCFGSHAKHLFSSKLEVDEVENQVASTDIHPRTYIDFHCQCDTSLTSWHWQRIECPSYHKAHSLCMWAALDYCCLAVTVLTYNLFVLLNYVWQKPQCALKTLNTSQCPIFSSTLSPVFFFLFFLCVGCSFCKALATPKRIVFTTWGLGEYRPIGSLLQWPRPCS